MKQILTESRCGGRCHRPRHYLQHPNRRRPTTTRTAAGAADSSSAATSSKSSPGRSTSMLPCTGSSTPRATRRRWKNRASVAALSTPWRAKTPGTVRWTVPRTTSFTCRPTSRSRSSGRSSSTATETWSMLQTDQQFPSVSSQTKELREYRQVGGCLFRAAASAREGEELVQTIPGKGFNVWYRLDSPLEPWFDKTWRLGEIELVE